MVIFEMHKSDLGFCQKYVRSVVAIVDKLKNLC